MTQGSVGDVARCLGCFAFLLSSACCVGDVLDWEDVTGPVSRRNYQLEGLSDPPVLHPAPSGHPFPSLC